MLQPLPAFPAGKGLHIKLFPYRPRWSRGRITTLLSTNRIAALAVIPVGVVLIAAIISVGEPTPNNRRVLSAEDTNTEAEAIATSSTNSIIKVAQAEEPQDGAVDPKPYEYTVEGGDSLSAIAEKFNLKLETILWANNLNAKSVIKPGKILIILPVDGTLHTVGKGDTVSDIAAIYGVEANVVTEYNGLVDPTLIHVGDKVLVPGGKQPVKKAIPATSATAKSVPADSVETAVSGKLVWPAATSNITQYYSAKHRGVDMGNGQKPAIYSAHDGVVEYAGWESSWGNTVVIRGDDGLVTRYAHASEIYVSNSERVASGQTIAKVGNTGRVSGPTGLHLHFGVYKNGVAINPIPLLK